MPEREEEKGQYRVGSEEDRGKENHIEKKGRKKQEDKEELHKLEEMRERLIRGLEIQGTSERVLKAMLRVPRHMFVPEYAKKGAYIDTPLDIGFGQTISAPHMVAIMCDLLELSEGLKVLEIGTGSGYNAAVMGELVGKSGHVYTIERIESLVNFARENLNKAGYENVTVLLEDGSIGYSGYAPYDRVAVTCAAPDIPKPLLEQLKPGGIMVIPVGNYVQDLIRIKKDNEGNVHKETRGGVVFVPLRGKFGF
ncbi:protein-L-isoaspartate O-methyltransferase [Methanosarcina sp.]|uniref:protein-L-isoaspartate O-methyltransferase n=1 Tax=Methanosarcina sp. TaxID=2213 RepID=UPI002AB99145|nr:protein-L-isoaspartate O-methyltransferase [Methanosarcina sp.]MDY9927080.1 protein-L-isoaspartate O-methyltransferase [Methanosarcina sp.]